MTLYSINFNFPETEFTLEDYFNNSEELLKLGPLPHDFECPEDVTNWLYDACQNGILPYQFLITEMDNFDKKLGTYDIVNFTSGEEWEDI